MSNEPRYPDLNEKSLAEQVAELKDYIVNLHRYIRYADNNIAERNLTRTLEDKINSYVDADGVVHILDELGFDSEVGFYNYVTFHNLQTEGETIINGDNITTGTVLADYIDVAGLISANNIIVSSDLTDGSTIISGDNILTGTIDADYLNVNDIISTGNIIVTSNLTDGTTQISGDNILTGTIDASQVTVTNIDADEINAGHVTADYLDLKGLTIKDGQNNNTLTIDNNGNFWTSGAVENSIDYVDATALSKPTKANLINAANGYYVLKDGKWVSASDNVDWVNDNYSSLTIDEISKANVNLLTKTITIDDGKLLWETTDASNNVNKVIEFSGEDYTAQGGLSTFDIDFYNYTGLDANNKPNNWNLAGSIYSLCPSVGSNHQMVLSSTGDIHIGTPLSNGNHINFVSDDLRINNNTIEDFVVDEGTSNSWYYRIWNSGRMECWQRFTKTASAINTPSGSLYTTSGSTTFSNYPNNFSAAPTVNMSLESNQGLMLAVTGTGTDSTPPSIKVMRTEAKTSSTTFYVDVHASGMKASS